jgi:hypothetical protein
MRSLAAGCCWGQLGFFERFFQLCDVGGVEAVAHFIQRPARLTEFQRATGEVDADDAHGERIRRRGSFVEACIRRGLSPQDHRSLGWIAPDYRVIRENVAVLPPRRRNCAEADESASAPRSGLCSGMMDDDRAGLKGNVFIDDEAFSASREVHVIQTRDPVESD